MVVQLLLFWVWPVCPLAWSVQCTTPISYMDDVTGKALSKICLAVWLCECISQVHKQGGRDPPTVIPTHTPLTCSVAVSTALFSGMSMGWEDICAEALWSALLLLVWFYLLDMSGSLSQSVLDGLNQEWWKECVSIVLKLHAFWAWYTCIFLVLQGMRCAESVVWQ